jgi:ferredoxin-NADP reductase
MNQMFPMGQAMGRDLTAVSLVLMVAGRRTVGEGIEEFRFENAGGGPLPAWRPGAHVEFILPFGDGSERRCYSLLGDPDDKTWRIAVLKQPEGLGGSLWMHENLQPGAVLPAVGPRHAFAFPNAECYLFIAGGIGITPLLPMIAAAENSGKVWDLVYLARHESRFAYAEELRAYPGGNVLFYASEQPDFDFAARLAALSDGTAVQACGPTPMLNLLETLAAGAGGRWTLSVERFAAPAPGGGDRAFEVQLARSGKTLTVPADRSVLEVLKAAGIKVESSCRTGSCGTCECGVLEGAIDHRDQVLTPSEREGGNTMMVCVSRAAGDRLVLDI